MDTEEAVLGLAKGDLIGGRYEVRGLLGKGGFAAVFRAYDRHIEREVAIKVLNILALVSQGNDLDVMLARFRREAKLAARISHPNVVEIYDYGIVDGQDNPFIIMEILDGHDLAREIKERGPLNPRKFIPLFVDCLEALGDAHQMEIVHKDLKPSNLFYANPGGRRSRLKLVDFGIAHLGDGEDSRLTRTGFMLGTPQYMAPEYVEEQLVSPALDVYQMGLILVELLAARAVVEGETPWKCTLMHVSRELSVPLDLMKSPLGPVIERALALDPSDRFADGLEFAEALSAVDPQEVPHLEDDAELQILGASPDDEIQTPKEDTRKLIEEAQTARAEASLSDVMIASAAGEEEVTTPSMAARAPGSSEALSRTEQLLAEMRGGRAPIVVVAVTVAIAAVVGLVAFFPGDESDDEAVDQARAEVGTELDSEESSPIEEQTGHLDEDEESADTELEGEVRVIAIEVEPADALIDVDGLELGRGAAKITFEDGETGARELLVTHEGFEPFRSEIGPDVESPIQVELQRREPAGSTTSPSAAPSTPSVPTTASDPEDSHTPAGPSPGSDRDEDEGETSLPPDDPDEEDDDQGFLIMP